MIEIGRHCVKIAGRDAGSHCLIIDVLDPKTVMIDGETRRRKCNVQHLEPLEKVAKLRKGASHESVVEALRELGVKVRVHERVPRKKKAAAPKETKA